MLEIARATLAGEQAGVEHALADYELAVQRRLDHTRILVRAGPALGLMGTLIPLAPGLAALGQGEVARWPQTCARRSPHHDRAAVGTVAFALTLTAPVCTAKTSPHWSGPAPATAAAAMAAQPRSCWSPDPDPPHGLGRHGRIEDAAGDPLDGLVNLFDIGIVLAVAFLIAGLGLTLDQHTHRLQRAPPTTQQTQRCPAVLRRPGRQRPRSGSRHHSLSNGQLVYVQKRALNRRYVMAYGGPR